MRREAVSEDGLPNYAASGMPDNAIGVSVLDQNGRKMSMDFRPLSDLMKYIKIGPA